MSTRLSTNLTKPPICYETLTIAFLRWKQRNNDYSTCLSAPLNCEIACSTYFTFWDESNKIGVEWQKALITWTVGTMTGRHTGTARGEFIWISTAPLEICMLLKSGIIHTYSNKISNVHVMRNKWFHGKSEARPRQKLFYSPLRRLSVDQWSCVLPAIYIKYFWSFLHFECTLEKIANAHHMF